MMTTEQLKERLVEALDDFTEDHELNEGEASFLSSLLDTVISEASTCADDSAKRLGRVLGETEEHPWVQHISIDSEED